jgi:hypothetical protein
MTIDISTITVCGREEFKLRINDVLHGVFRTREEAEEYAALPEVATTVAVLTRMDKWK